MIRHATIKDYDAIMGLLANFADAAPLDSLHKPQSDQRRVGHFLTELQRTGVVLVAEADGQIQGMILGQIQPDTWLPYIRTLRELAWWVEPDYRNTTVGYRLLKAYTDFGKHLQRTDQIDQFTLTLLTNSPDLGLEKRGWVPIETNYVYKGDR